MSATSDGLSKILLYVINTVSWFPEELVSLSRLNCYRYGLCLSP